MRTLGIDYGRVRLGLALSDVGEVLATPLPALERSRCEAEDVARVVAVAQEHGVTNLVVGLPLLLDGTHGTMADEAETFARLLSRASRLPVRLFDERLTSSEAERAMLEGDLSRRKRRRLRDGLAATLILQAYLDEQSAARREPNRES